MKRSALSQHFGLKTTNARRRQPQALVKSLRPLQGRRVTDLSPASRQAARLRFLLYWRPDFAIKGSKRLAAQLEVAAAKRHDAWVQGAPSNITARATSDLERLHSDKRSMRREIYRDAPSLEGRPIFKGDPSRRVR